MKQAIPWFSNAEQHVELPQVPAIVRRFSLLQTVVAGAKTVVASVLLSATGPVAPAVVALLTFAIYNVNDLADVEEDSINRPESASFVARWRREIAAVSGLAIVAAVALAGYHGGTVAVAVALLPLGAAVLYSLPCLPGTDARLKDVFAVNTVLVASAWAATTTLLPAVIAGPTSEYRLVAVFLFLFLRTVVSVELFNVRDVAGDRAAGVATVPVVVGVPRTRIILLLIDAATVGVVFGVASVVSLSPALVAALFVLFLFSMGLTSLLMTPLDRDWLCLAKDGEYLAMGLLAALL